MNELDLLNEADSRGRRYVASVGERRVYPDAHSLAKLSQFNEALPEIGAKAIDTLTLLDEVGSDATSVSNGPRYFGFVIGAVLPVAAAAERMVLAWDQCASSFQNSPVANVIERRAAHWILDILDLPRESAVNFGTSASTCALGCLSVARRELLKRQDWNLDTQGLAGAPEIRVVLPQNVHVTVKKALRVLGFGERDISFAPVDQYGRIEPEKLPRIDSRTILCLQAGEVNTGEFDLFEPLIKQAKNVNAWVHVDGAFGLWARANGRTRCLTDGVEQADSWTTDGHKWLNTPYDTAVGICRHATAVSEAMNSDAVYSTSSDDSQKNLGLEFSRRARGISMWAALRTLGRAGVADLVEHNCGQAQRLKDGLESAGFTIHNRVVLNQVLVSLGSELQTNMLREAAEASGEIWFGPTVWQGKTVFRLSLSSWRTTEGDIDRAIKLLTDLRTSILKT